MKSGFREEPNKDTGDIQVKVCTLQTLMKVVESARGTRGLCTMVVITQRRSIQEGGVIR